MRDSLKQSLVDSPAGDQVDFRHPKGSIVICNACALPIAILERGIAVGDKAGQMARAIVPLRDRHLVELAARADIDPGIRAWARSLSDDQRKAHCEKLQPFKSGDPMLCPCCHQCFAQVVSVDKHEVLDKAYVIELVTLPPRGMKVLPVRGRQIGTDRDWLHERAPLVG